MAPKIAIVAGVRTPFSRKDAQFSTLPARELGRLALSEAIARGGVDPSRLGAIIFGSVAQGQDGCNLARSIALAAGIPETVPASCVNRDCASGLQAIISGAQAIATGEADLVAVGGVESLSNFPAFLPVSYNALAQRYRQRPSWSNRLACLRQFRPSEFLAPPVMPMDAPEPSCGLNQGESDEGLARELAISREAQDEYALESHRRATAAKAAGRGKEEIMTVLLAPDYQEMVDSDEPGEPSRESLAQLPPLHDAKFGTVTAGNSAPPADGAVVLLLAGERAVSRYSLAPLGYVREHAFAGLAPQRMGLGAAHALAKLMERSGHQLGDFGLIEIHEGSAAQLLATELVCAEESLARRYLQRPAVGRLDRNLLNVNGGALALGHPPGASGARLVLTLLLEMRRRKVDQGLAACGSGGGQGTALIIERGKI